MGNKDIIGIGNTYTQSIACSSTRAYHFSILGMATLLRTITQHAVLCCAVRKEDVSQVVSIQYMLCCYCFMEVLQFYAGKIKSHSNREQYLSMLVLVLVLLLLLLFSRFRNPCLFYQRAESTALRLLCRLVVVLLK